MRRAAGAAIPLGERVQRLPALGSPPRGISPARNPARPGGRRYGLQAAAQADHRAGR
jgi:hypothetical protein